MIGFGFLDELLKESIFMESEIERERERERDLWRFEEVEKS